MRIQLNEKNRKIHELEADIRSLKENIRSLNDGGPISFDRQKEYKPHKKLKKSIFYLFLIKLI
jgi:hypothetical protein